MSQTVPTPTSLDRTVTLANDTPLRIRVVFGGEREPGALPMSELPDTVSTQPRR